MKKKNIRQFLEKTAPDYHTFKNNLLSDKCIMLWRIRATIILIIYSFLDGGMLVFFPFWAIIFGILGIISYIILIVFYLPLLYHHCGYFFEHNILSINSGVIIYHRTKIPVSKIQYCVISQGPIQRIFGLCSLRVLMAGSFESVSQITLINAYRLKNDIENPAVKQGDSHGKKKV